MSNGLSFLERESSLKKIICLVLIQFLFKLDFPVTFFTKHSRLVVLHHRVHIFVKRSHFKKALLLL